MLPPRIDQRIMSFSRRLRECSSTPIVRHRSGAATFIAWHWGFARERTGEIAVTGALGKKRVTMPGFPLQTRQLLGGRLVHRAGARATTGASAGLLCCPIPAWQGGRSGHRRAGRAAAPAMTESAPILKPSIPLIALRCESVATVFGSPRTNAGRFPLSSPPLSDGSSTRDQHNPQSPMHQVRCVCAGDHWANCVRIVDIRLGFGRGRWTEVVFQCKKSAEQDNAMNSQ